jgi:hypothetical protein
VGYRDEARDRGGTTHDEVGTQAKVDRLIVGASRIEVEVEPQLRRGLANRARGRPVVIDYYASRRCGLTVGDLTITFATRPLKGRYIELVPIDGVKVLAEERLVHLLSEGATYGSLGCRFPIAWGSR